MSLAPEVIEKLGKPLDPKRVKKREGGGGKSLSYLESHDVIRTANDVFGIGGWSYRVNELVCLATEKFIGRDAREGTRTGYRATVTVRVGDTEYGDVGYGDATEYTNSAVTTHENASKEAVSDAVKRALRNFGDQFGLCLYSKDAPEHNGHNQAAVGGSGTVAAGTDGTQTAGATAPTTSSDGWTWPFGKHKGKTLAETDEGYLAWFLNNSDKEDIKQRVREFQTLGAFSEVQGGSFVDDDIPFDRTIDGLGG